MTKCNNCKKERRKETIVNGLCEECRKQLKSEPTETNMLEYLKEEDRKKLFGVKPDDRVQN